MPDTEPHSVLIALVPEKTVALIEEVARDVEMRLGRPCGEGEIIRRVVVNFYERFLTESIKAERSLLGVELLAMLEHDHEVYEASLGRSHEA